MKLRILVRCSVMTLVALVAGGSLGARPSAARPPQEARVIEVVAKRFAFEPAEIEVTVGQPVRLMVRSADGIHGVAITRLKVKKDIPRGGKAIPIEFTPTEVGRFPILCSEYCGDSHAEMKGMLVVSARPDAAAQ